MADENPTQTCAVSTVQESHVGQTKGKEDSDAKLVTPERKRCLYCGQWFLLLYSIQLYCNRQCRRKRANAKLWRPTDKLDTIERMQHGMAAEMLVCADLLCKGVEVFRAVSGVAPFDLIACDHQLAKRIEVRKGRVSNDGRLVRLSKGLHKGNGWKMGLDVLAIVIVDKEMQRVFYFKPRSSHYYAHEQYEFWREMKKGSYLTRRWEWKGKPVSKLSREKAAKIREMWATGQYTTRGLGRMFGVSSCSIVAVTQGRIYRLPQSAWQPRRSNHPVPVDE